MEISKNIRRLSKSEISQYDSEGFIKNLPVFSKRGVEELQLFFNELKNRLPSSIDINKTNMWHKASKKFYDVAHTPEILDYVEDLLGPNFYLWGGQFFYKPALSKSIVPWHQDSQYWPLKPSNSVTVWLAIFDTNKEIVELSFFALLSVKNPSINGSLVYLTTDEYSFIDGFNQIELFLYTGSELSEYPKDSG